MSRGKVHPKTALFLRQGVGSAEGEGGLSYDLCTTMSGAPMVQSKHTGQTFILDWSDIINMAVEAGVDEEVTS